MQGCLQDVISQQFAQRSMALPICSTRWNFFAHSAPSVFFYLFILLLSKPSLFSGESRFCRVLPDDTKQCGECSRAWSTSRVKQAMPCALTSKKKASIQTVVSYFSHNQSTPGMERPQAGSAAGVSIVCRASRWRNVLLQTQESRRPLTDGVCVFLDPLHTHLTA